MILWSTYYFHGSSNLFYSTHGPRLKRKVELLQVMELFCCKMDKDTKQMKVFIVYSINHSSDLSPKKRNGFGLKVTLPLLQKLSIVTAVSGLHIACAAN